MKSFDAEKARILDSVRSIWPGLSDEEALVRMILLHEQTVASWSRVQENAEQLQKSFLEAMHENRRLRLKVQELDYRLMGESKDAA